MQNTRDEINKEFRISHDALFNLYELCFQLRLTDQKGDPKDFITHITLHPRIVVHLMSSPLLDSLKLIVNVSSDPVLLHYDTVFNMGDYYMSTLTFRQALFVGNPVIPCAFLIHSRRYHSDHKLFLDAVTQLVPSLLSKKVALVTDREFKFSDMFPVGFHLFCWNHMENDLHWYLRNRSNCTSEEISFFSNSFKRLMMNGTEVEFDREWENLKSNYHFISNTKICNYFETKLLPSFKEHASIWVLKAAGVSNPDRGITNNASESMNAVLHRLQQWKHAPLDVIAISLYHLCTFYQREQERSIHQCGQWDIKDQYDYYKRDPSLMPQLPPSISPKDIVDRVQVDIKHEPPKAVHKENGALRSNIVSGQIGLAYHAISEGRVKLVDNGAWMVINSDGSTPCAVKLFPKETCSCNSTKTCLHITACRLMVGLPPTETGKASLSELRRRQRKPKERPSGRKQPRKDDFEKTDGLKSKLRYSLHYTIVNIPLYTCRYEG